MTTDDDVSTPMLLEIAAGSVTGHEHVISGKNNQDSFAVTTVGDYTVAVVCDGCGSSPHSEAGSYLGARFIGNTLACRLNFGSAQTKDSTWEEAHREIITRLYNTAEWLRTQPGGKREATEDSLLFTAVGVAIGPSHVTPFSIGDGVLYLNDIRIELGPFANNAPPYIGYGILRNNGGWKSEDIAFKLHGHMPVSEFQHVMIGSDGVDDLNKAIYPAEELRQFWTEDRYFKNRDLVRRRMALLNQGGQAIDWEQRCITKKPHMLPDDTTLVAIRRKAA